MDSTFINLEELIKQAGLTVPTQKKKFLLVGTHAHQTTGYSKVTYHILQELSKRNVCDLYHFGFQKFMIAPPGFRDYPPNVDVYDPALREKNKEAEIEQGFGYSQLPDYVNKVKPDIIFIYNDASVVCRFLDKLAEKIPEAERTYKMIVYLDQVYTIQRPELLARIDKDTHIFFAFTNYWKDVLEKQGIKKPIHVLRHGFDPLQFKLLDRSALRKKHNISENTIVLLNLNRNTPRKRYDLLMIAFAELIARHPTKPLALLAICDSGESGGYPIQEIFLRELIRLRMSPQIHASKLLLSKSALTYTDELINELYALSDIGVTSAEGEGFGLCQFEAMGVGIPQVVPDVGGFKDFCQHNINCKVVPIKYRSYLALSQSSVGGISETVDPFDLSIAIEDYILDTDMREEHGRKARETVLQYNWKKEVDVLADVLLSL